jgi:DNA-binding NarL/FixJ family response regulator
MRELPGPQGDAPPLRILHIEDDPGDALLVRRLLREMSGDNLRLVQAGTLSEGAADDHDPYDLAVLDLDLPDCRGLETIRRFRAARPDTPFLVLSANMDREIGLDALGHGAGAYVQKDRLTSTLLERRVQQTLARSRGPVNGTANPSAIVTPIPWPPTAPLPVDTMRLVVVRLANAGQSFDSPEPAWTVDPFEDATDPERRTGPQDLEEIALLVDDECGRLEPPIAVLVDSIAPLLATNPERMVAAFLRVLADRLGERLVERLFVASTNAQEHAVISAAQDPSR